MIVIRRALSTVVNRVSHYDQVSSVTGVTFGTILGFKCGLAKNSDTQYTRCVYATLGAATGTIIGGIIAPFILSTIVVYSPWMKTTVDENGINISG